MKEYLVPLPLRNIDKRDKYSEVVLLEDGSVHLSSQQDSLILDAKKREEISVLSHTEVRYEVTDNCNASCIMCPRDEHEHGRPHGIMSQENFEKSIDEVVGLGAKKVVLTGFGEPLLDRKLEQKIAYANKKGLKTYFITNGSALTPVRSKGILDAGLDEMRVSFYGMGKDTYNVVMKGLDYDKTQSLLLAFLKMRDEGGYKTKVQLSYLEMDENKKDTDAFRKFWEPLVEALEVWRPHNFGDGREYREREASPIVKKSCGRPQSGPLQIQWNGEVVPCCYDYNNKIVLGNAFQQPVTEILNNLKYRLLRQSHETKNFDVFPYCDQCDQLLPHADALIYTNRHNLPPEEAVKLSNTDLYDLQRGEEIGEAAISTKYKDKK